MATKTINEQWSIDESETVSLDDMKYTVIRVKRKITDDPEKALSVNSKKVKNRNFQVEINFLNCLKIYFREELTIFSNIVEVYH